MMKALSPDSPIIAAKLTLPATSKQFSNKKSPGDKTVSHSAFSDGATAKATHRGSGVAGKVSAQLSSWKTRIENSDAQSLWRSLHRLVSAHPLVRSAIGYSHAFAQNTSTS